nr:NRDE family protein [Oceanococcus sp. HetDA_MAG_MS8]
MCLIVFSWDEDQPALRLVANRDEFHARPSSPLGFWADAPEILAGRDLTAGGTWLGVSQRGRFAAITNVREPGSQLPENPRSRGHLVRDFLLSEQTAMEFCTALEPHAQEFPGFNLLVLDGKDMVYFGNRHPIQLLHSGHYGLSNAGLNSSWPKVEQSVAALAAQPNTASLSEDVQLLSRREAYADKLLPDTGVGLNAERLLSPPFIVSPGYGTRCTTALRWSPEAVQLLEHSYDSAGKVTTVVKESMQHVTGLSSVSP